MDNINIDELDWCVEEGIKHEGTLSNYKDTGLLEKTNLLLIDYNWNLFFNKNWEDIMFKTKQICNKEIASIHTIKMGLYKTLPAAIGMIRRIEYDSESNTKTVMIVDPTGEIPVFILDESNAYVGCLLLLSHVKILSFTKQYLIAVDSCNTVLIDYSKEIEKYL